jgi:hypothetical protein
MYLNSDLEKIHLNHLILQITDVLLSHSLRAFCRNKINYIKVGEGMHITPSGLWMLSGSGARSMTSG